MKLKGVDTFRQKVPLLSGKKIVFLPLYALSIISIAISVMIGFDSLPRLLESGGIHSDLLFLLPLLGVLLVCIVGFSLAFQMWFQKDALKAKYGKLAYQHIFFVGFTGISCVFALAFHLFIHYWSFSSSFWMNSSFKFLAIPIEGYFPSWGILLWLKIAFSAFFSLLGISMIIRAVFTFGFDYMTVIYLYYPEESKIQNHAIYSILRHPAYAGLLFVGLGGMFSTLTIYSVAFYLVLLIGFYIHIHFVEEKELIARFGPSYREYMKQVPAFFVKPGKLGDLFGFLLGKSG